MSRRPRFCWLQSRLSGGGAGVVADDAAEVGAMLVGAAVVHGVAHLWKILSPLAASRVAGLGVTTRIHQFDQISLVR